MRLRRRLLAITTTLAALTAVCAPATEASTPTGGPIVSIAVGGFSGNLSRSIALTMKSTSVTYNLYGIPTNISCTGGSASGVVNGGTTGISPSNAFTLTSIGMTCPSYYPGTTVGVSLVCDVGVVFADLNVHNGTNPATDILDTGVPGTSKVSAVDGVLKATNGAGTHCVQVTYSSGCTFRVGGQTPVQFDEANKGSNRQDLVLTGTGLQIKNPVACFGAVSNNQSITLSARFNVTSTNGLIDLRS